LTRAYREQYGCNFVTVLPTNVFGPGAAFRPDGPVIEGCISKALHHYDEAEPINFPGEELAIAEVVEKITRLVGFKGEVKWDSSKPDGPLRRTLDDEKLHKLLPNWKPTPFDEALGKTVEFAKANWGTRPNK